MKHQNVEVGFVRVNGGVDLAEATLSAGVAPGDIGLDSNGILTTRSPGNVLLDLGATMGVTVIRGIAVLAKDGKPQMLSGPLTIAVTSNSPAVSWLTFSHLDAAAAAGQRVYGSHLANVTIDSYMRPIQLFWRRQLDGGSGAWLVPDWAA